MYVNRKAFKLFFAFFFLSLSESRKVDWLWQPLRIRWKADGGKSFKWNSVSVRNFNPTDNHLQLSVPRMTFPPARPTLPETGRLLQIDESFRHRNEITMENERECITETSWQQQLTIFENRFKCITPRYIRCMCLSRVAYFMPHSIFDRGDGSRSYWIAIIDKTSSSLEDKGKYCWTFNWDVISHEWVSERKIYGVKSKYFIVFSALVPALPSGLLLQLFFIRNETRLISTRRRQHATCMCQRFVMNSSLADSRKNEGGKWF